MMNPEESGACGFGGAVATGAESVLAGPEVAGADVVATVVGGDVGATVEGAVIGVVAGTDEPGSLAGESVESVEGGASTVFVVRVSSVAVSSEVVVSSNARTLGALFGEAPSDSKPKDSPRNATTRVSAAVVT